MKTTIRVSLNETDLRILRELNAGKKNAEIARVLFTSEQTIKNRLTRLYKRIGVQSRKEAKQKCNATKILKNGYVTLALVRHVQTVRFTPRQIQVLRLLLEGKTNREIASKLSIDIQTVKNLLSGTYLQLGVDGREQTTEMIRELDNSEFKRLRHPQPRIYAPHRD